MVRHLIQSQLRKICSNPNGQEDAAELVNRRLEEMYKLNAARLSEKERKTYERTLERKYRFQSDADRIGADRHLLKDSWKRWEMVIASNPFRTGYGAFQQTTEPKPHRSTSSAIRSRRTGKQIERSRSKNHGKSRDQRAHPQNRDVQLPLGPRIKTQVLLCARPRSSWICPLSMTYRDYRKQTPITEQRPKSVPTNLTLGVQQVGHGLWSISRSYRELTSQVSAFDPNDQLLSATRSSATQSARNTSLSRTSRSTIRSMITECDRGGGSTAYEAIRQWCMADMQTQTEQLQKKVELFCHNTERFVSNCLRALTNKNEQRENNLGIPSTFILFSW
ncbi:unnamed protein product [Echinostoma caproni]|uniref:Uncharacterized protein n=1 Tax=Echinostoma caproni TaxID=27848 RepID=A0A183A4X5_9TREM|nr:unnamed protein product [Echinostoma caproni]